MNLSGNAPSHILAVNQDLKIDEHFVKTKIDQMCGQPTKEKKVFYEQNDETLGKALRRLCKEALSNCERCHTPKFKHIKAFYHRDGCLEVAITLSDKKA